MRRLMLPALALLAVLAPTAQAAPTCANHEPDQCGAYVLFDYRWPVGPSKPLVLDYLVNPRNNGSLPDADMPRLVAAAARTWERANPRVRFRFAGLTDAVPGLQDGKNVIGWGVVDNPAAQAGAATFTADGVILEADIVLNLGMRMEWQQCRQADSTCKGHPTPHEPGTFWFAELQSIVTHELGHWLSLDHPDAAGGEHLTMAGSFDGFHTLEYQTLGLGDVLGVRAAYPCGGCGGKPVVYSP